MKKICAALAFLMLAIGPAFPQSVVIGGGVSFNGGGGGSSFPIIATQNGSAAAPAFTGANDSLTGWFIVPASHGWTWSDNGVAGLVINGTAHDFSPAASGGFSLGFQNPFSKFAAVQVTYGLNVVTFSATPSFDFSLGDLQKLTLTGNVTSSTALNLISGEKVTLILCQDATGSRTFVFPTSFSGGVAINSTANACTAETFTYDGTTAYNTTGGTSGGGGTPYPSGSGIPVVVAGAAWGTTLAAPTGTISGTVASGTATLGTSAISSGTCASAVTVTATGTAATDVVLTGYNVDPTSVTGYAPSAAGSLYIQPYPTVNNVNFKVCNNTAGSITPSALTLNWKVIR